VNNLILLLLLSSSFPSKGETASGDFADTAVATMADIVATAEIGVDYYSQFSFIRYWATKHWCVFHPCLKPTAAASVPVSAGNASGAITACV
jgi:pyruvate kinase